jgi:hypothetical protein
MVLGHFDAVFTKCFVASAIAESEVPFGFMLSPNPAEYAGPLTPWQATSLLKFFFKPLQRPGPTLLGVP